MRVKVKSRDRFVAVFNASVTNADTARTLGITRERVRQLAVEYGLPARPRGQIKATIPEDFADLHAAPENTLRILADAFDVCLGTIQRWAKELKLPPRPKGIAAKARAAQSFYADRRAEFAADWYAKMPEKDMAAKYGYAQPLSVSHVARRLGLPSRHPNRANAVPRTAAPPEAA